MKDLCLILDDVDDVFIKKVRMYKVGYLLQSADRLTLVNVTPRSLLSFVWPLQLYMRQRGFPDFYLGLFYKKSMFLLESNS